MASLSLKWTAGCVVYKGSLAFLGLRNKDTTFRSQKYSSHLLFCLLPSLQWQLFCSESQHLSQFQLQSVVCKVLCSVNQWFTFSETMVQALIHQKGAMTQVSLDEHFPGTNSFSSTASWWLHLHLFAFVSVFIFLLKQIEVNLFKCQGMDCLRFTKINAFV